MEIKFIIKETDKQRVIDAENGLCPKEEGFTEAQWAKESIRRLIRDRVYRWESKVAQEQIKIEKDNTLIT